MEKRTLPKVVSTYGIQVVNLIRDIHYHFKATGATYLPPSFAAGFDSMTVLPNRKTYYVTKGNEYIHYSEKSASRVDPGYPKPLQRYWGGPASELCNQL